MTNTKTTKRALLSSVMALFLCISMLIGTTFAWFADEVISAGNKIQAGDLEIDLLLRDVDGVYASVKKTKAPIFNYELWEPGYTQVANVKVHNIGTLALQYHMQIITEGLVDELLNDEIMLSDVIDVYYAPTEVILESRAAFNQAIETKTLKHVGTLTDVLFGASLIRDTLLPNEEDYATIVLKMQETAGNDYEGLSVGSAFDIKIVATQLMSEKDSFDDQYDFIQLPYATVMKFDKDMLEMYTLDAGCAYVATEVWDDSWGYDYVNDKPIEGTPDYAYYYVDYVVSFSKDHAAGEVGLWGYYEAWGAQESFKMDAITAGVDYRVIPIAAEKTNINMGSISYRQLLDEVQRFGCGVTKGSLKAGETITVTLRLYETKLNGGNSFVETGTYYDVAVFTYTEGTVNN